MTMPSMPDSLDQAAWISLIAGSLLLLFGPLLIRSAVTVTGAVLGAALGLGGGHGFALIFEAEGTLALGLHVGGIVLGAIAGVLLFRFVEVAAFFILGAALTVWALLGVAPHAESFGIPEPQFVMTIAIPIIAVLVGIMAVFLKRFIIGVATSAAGSFLIMNALGWPWMGLPAIGLFILGLVIQFGIFRGRRSRRDDQGD